VKFYVSLTSKEGQEEEKIGKVGKKNKKSTRGEKELSSMMGKAHY